MTTSTQVVKTSVTVNTVSQDGHVLAVVNTNIQLMSYFKPVFSWLPQACQSIHATMPRISQSKAPRKAIRNSVNTCPICDCRGGSRIVFRRACTRLLLYFNTNKPHSFFLQNTSCIRKPQVISGGGAHPLNPLPRSAPGDSTLEIGAAQLPSVTEIAPPQRFLCVNRCPIQYYFRGGAKGIRSSVTLHPPPRSGLVWQYTLPLDPV